MSPAGAWGVDDGVRYRNFDPLGLQVRVPGRGLSRKGDWGLPGGMGTDFVPETDMAFEF